MSPDKQIIALQAHIEELTLQRNQAENLLCELADCHHVHNSRLDEWKRAFQSRRNRARIRDQVKTRKLK